MSYTQYPNTTFVIDMTQELKGGEVFSQLVTKTLNTYLPVGKRLLIYVPSIAYASGHICNDCGAIPHCTQCDVSVQYHQAESGQMYGLCPICKHQYSADAECHTCHSHDMIMYGVGAQQVQKILKSQWGVEAMILGGKYSNSLSKIKKLQSDIQDAQVMLSTTMTIDSSPGLPVDAVIVLDADRGLHSPDYQASWKTFMMLYQLVVSYRDVPVLIQSHKPDHQAIVLACNEKIETMKRIESERRSELQYPPFAQMCVLHYKNEVEQRTLSTVNKLYQELVYLKQTYEYPDIQIWSTPPSIFKKFGKYRYTIVMKGPGLREYMDIAYSKLKMRSRGFKVDWEPQALI